jgi:peptidoglycan L-alanyl-D-glutamate endopeptidase CwlK
MLTIRSEQRLADVDQRLAAVVRDAVLRCRVHFTVVEGRRTKERQAELYAQGRTKPGKICTWTLESKHIEGKAVDLAPIADDGSIDWKNLKAFDAIAKAMFEAAQVLEYPIRWGADWDQDGKPRERGEFDSPHFELAL